MKKLIFACAVGLLLVNCTNSDQIEENKSESSTSRVAYGSALRVFYDNGGSDYGCKAPPVSCLDDTVVVSRLSIADFKKDYIKEDALILLNKGSLSLSTKFNTSTNTEYFILTNTSDNSVYEVYPFKNR